MDQGTGRIHLLQLFTLNEYSARYAVARHCRRRLCAPRLTRSEEFIHLDTHTVYCRGPGSQLWEVMYTKWWKKHCCSHLRSNFFSFTVVRLSSDVVGLSAPSVNAFKRRRLDKYWTNYWIKKISYLQDKEWTAKRPRGPKSNRTDFILGTLY